MLVVAKMQHGTERISNILSKQSVSVSPCTSNNQWGHLEEGGDKRYSSQKKAKRVDH